MPRTAQGRRWQPRPPRGGPHNFALAGCDVSYQSDLVRVDTLPVVDMWSPEEDHIWGALDEGCNSTCHSKAWGELAEDRLRYFDLTFPWIDGSTKSFAGLGSSTKTLEKRDLPFCIQVGEDSLAGAMESHEVDTEAFNPLLVSLFAQAKLGLIKDMAHCKCYIGDLEVPMARCAHTGLLLLCLSQFARRSKLPRVVESLRVPSPGTRTAMMLAPSHWHINGYVWDPNGPLASQDQVWPDILIVTAGVKHCFPAGDHRGVNTADAWRSYLPKAIANRKIILTDTRQLPNPDPGVIDEQLSSGTGMYLLQSTFEAIEKATKLNPQLVVLDFYNANRHRSVAKGTIMSCMLVEKGIAVEDHVPTAAAWTQEGPRKWQKEHSKSFCQTLMSMIHRTVPTNKGGHCRYPCRPGALRPGLGLPLPLGDLLQLSQVQSVGLQVGLRPQALHPLHPP